MRHLLGEEGGRELLAVEISVTGIPAGNLPRTPEYG
jgi:hypothetical protein